MWRKDLKNTKTAPEKIEDKNNYKFDVFDEDGNRVSGVNMQLNTFSKVWKIENL